MRILIDNLNVFYSEKVRIIKTLMKRESEKEYFTQFKWKLQMLYFDGNRWTELCRIDNYLHKNMNSSHIHIIGQRKVRMANLSYDEAEKEIENIAKRILRDKFNEIVDFGGKT